MALVSEFDPENDQSGIRIASVHIPNQFALIQSMLIGMMRASGSVPEGIPRAVITVFQQ